MPPQQVGEVRTHQETAIKRIYGRPAIAVLSTTVLALVAAGCSSTAGSATASSSASSTSPSTGAVPAAQYSKALHDALPASVLAAGELKMAGINFPPYAEFAADGTTVQGLNVDLADAFSTVLGVKVGFAEAASTTGIYSGLASARYDVGVSPYSDTVTTEKSYDFVDWLHEYVAFAVATGNPKQITSLDTACGHAIATLQGGSAATVLKAQSTKCVAEGKSAITVNTFPDQATAILSVQSGRSDAAFSSQVPLTYYVAKSDGALELAGRNQANGFPNLLIGMYVPKGSALSGVLLDVFKSLDLTGTYDALLKKYGLTNNKIAAFGVDLGGKS